VSTVTHSYDTAAVLSQLLIGEDKHYSGRRLKVCKICNENQEDVYKDRKYPVIE
jgi:hypothetical protein